MSLPASVFECQICFQVLTNPVSCSRCGKLLCKEHVARISECPLCKDKPFRLQVERGVRLLLEEMPYPCKYCREPISKGNLEVHETNCHKRPRHCRFAGCAFKSCEQTEALRHLIELHGQAIWESYTDFTASMKSLYYFSSFRVKCLTCFNEFGQ